LQAPQNTATLLLSIATAFVEFDASNIESTFRIPKAQFAGKVHFKGSILKALAVGV